jgi:LysM repeat protein
MPGGFSLCPTCPSLDITTTANYTPPITVCLPVPPDRAAYFTHVVKKGETIGKLAKRYGTTERAIKRANGLRSSKIYARKAYKIPRTDHTPVSIVGGPVKIPPRRLPPARTEIPARAGTKPGS